MSVRSKLVELWRSLDQREDNSFELDEDMDQIKNHLKDEN